MSIFRIHLDGNKKS
ncbi:TPA: hypothetical protein ACNE4O_000020 [Escherichia coli]